MRLLALLITIISLFTGYFLSPIIYKKNIKILLFYPIWITNKLKQLLNKEIKFYTIFLLILSINSTTLLFILISGNIPILPSILLCWLGINLGISIFHISGKAYFLSIFINPVAILEITATVITGYNSVKLSIQNLANILQRLLPNISNPTYTITLASTFKIFLHYSLPILVFAAVIETLMIKIKLKLIKNTNEEEK